MTVNKKAKTAYCNERGQMDTYFRVLPPTDDPAQVLEYLLPMWRSFRESEAKMTGNMPLVGMDLMQDDRDFSLTVQGHIREVELDGIYALLDALCDVDLPSRWEASEDLLMEKRGSG